MPSPFQPHGCSSCGKLVNELGRHGAARMPKAHMPATQANEWSSANKMPLQCSRVSQGPSHPDGLTLYILGPRGRARSGTSRAATRWPLATYLQRQRRRGFESHRCRAINNLAVEVPPVSNWSHTYLQRQVRQVEPGSLYWIRKKEMFPYHKY